MSRLSDWVRCATTSAIDRNRAALDAAVGITCVTLRVRVNRRTGEALSAELQMQAGDEPVGVGPSETKGIST